jgi:hypothetical protein
MGAIHIRATQSLSYADRLAADQRPTGPVLGQPTWTRRTMSRYALFAPTQVWRVMLGRLWAAHAHDAAVVGATTFHQITLYVWTVPPPSA